jgi:hypothetical protein
MHILLTFRLPATLPGLACLLLICAGCSFKPFDTSSDYTERKLAQLTMDDRKALIQILHEEAARYDRSFWMAAKGNQIREFIGKIESRDKSVIVICDDQNRIVQLKSGISKLKLKKKKTP